MCRDHVMFMRVRCSSGRGDGRYRGTGENDHDLPPLTGSEKQLSWATRTRYEILSTALEELTGDGEMSAEDFESRILVPARKVLKPSWWIDNKDAEPCDIEELVSTAVDEDELVETENPF